MNIFNFANLYYTYYKPLTHHNAPALRIFVPAILAGIRIQIIFFVPTLLNNFMEVELSAGSKSKF